MQRNNYLRIFRNVNYVRLWIVAFLNKKKKIKKKHFHNELANLPHRCEFEVEIRTGVKFFYKSGILDCNCFAPSKGEHIFVTGNYIIQAPCLINNYLFQTYFRTFAPCTTPAVSCQVSGKVRSQDSILYRFRAIQVALLFVKGQHTLLSFYIGSALNQQPSHTNFYARFLQLNTYVNYMVQKKFAPVQLIIVTKVRSIALEEMAGTLTWHSNRCFFKRVTIINFIEIIKVTEECKV